MTDELRPCPFCGSHDLGDYRFPDFPDSAAPDDISIICNYCGALGPPCGTWPAARDAWNERVGDKILEAENTMLQGELATAMKRPNP